MKKEPPDGTDFRFNVWFSKDTYNTGQFLKYIRFEKIKKISMSMNSSEIFVEK